MDDGFILREMENVADELGLDVRYESIYSRGGLCRIEARRCVILNKSSPLSEVILTLTEALSRFPLEDLFIHPQIRELLEHCERSSLLKTS